MKSWRLASCLRSVQLHVRRIVVLVVLVAVPMQGREAFAQNYGSVAIKRS